MIKRASSVAAEVLGQLKEHLRPGVSTAELDKEAEKLFSDLGATSAFKGYRGYPASICTSVNDEVVHGIPAKHRLKAGDIISLDVGAKLNGYFGDIAWTFPVGKITQEAEQLFERIAAAEPNEWLPNYYVAQMNLYMKLKLMKSKS